MASGRLIVDIANDIRRLVDELAGNTSTPPRNSYPAVYDLQPLGYTKIGAVEEYRDELNKGGGNLAKRFAASLPTWWYVQDAEDYVEMTDEQKSLQDFNCGNARFSLAIIGTSASDNSLWRTYIPAVQRTYNDDLMKFEDTVITHAGEGVYAVANDSRSSLRVNSRTLTTNPRVKDMGDVVRNAFKYFYERNVNATHDPNGNAFG